VEGLSCGIAAGFKVAGVLPVAPARQHYLAMTLEKPSSFVRGNAKNAISLKKRLSQDYSGDHAAKTTKQLKARKANNPATKVKAVQRQLHRECLRAFAHWKDHGDYTAIMKIAQSAPGQRTRYAVLAWFEHVSGLRWENHVGRFVGKDRGKAKTLQAAASISIWSAKKPKNGLTPLVPARHPLGPLPKCKVCGHPAMPTEDICFGHQSE
jgi:hypothetical protein